MTLNTPAAALEDLVSRVERIAAAIEQGGREVDLHDLRLGLINVLSVVARDPGNRNTTRSACVDNSLRTT